MTPKKGRIEGTVGSSWNGYNVYDGRSLSSKESLGKELGISKTECQKLKHEEHIKELKTKLVDISRQLVDAKQTAKDCYKSCERLEKMRAVALNSGAQNVKLAMEIGKLKQQKDNIMKAKVKMFKGCVIEPFNSEIKRLEKEITALNDKSAYAHVQWALEERKNQSLTAQLANAKAKNVKMNLELMKATKKPK
jgi:hypothetical protein